MKKRASGITLEEAIKRLGNLAIHHRDDTFHENEEAIKLGIEALTVIRTLRSQKHATFIPPLPGETKDS